MKRILAFLLLSVMLLTFAACGNTATIPDSGNTREFTDST